MGQHQQAVALGELQLQLVAVAGDDDGMRRRRQHVVLHERADRAERGLVGTAVGAVEAVAAAHAEHFVVLHRQALRELGLDVGRELVEALHRGARALGQRRAVPGAGVGADVQLALVGGQERVEADAQRHLVVEELLGLGHAVGRAAVEQRVVVLDELREAGAAQVDAHLDAGVLQHLVHVARAADEVAQARRAAVPLAGRLEGLDDALHARAGGRRRDRRRARGRAGLGGDVHLAGAFEPAADVGRLRIQRVGAAEEDGGVVQLAHRQRGLAADAQRHQVARRAAQGLAAQLVGEDEVAAAQRLVGLERHRHRCGRCRGRLDLRGHGVHAALSASRAPPSWVWRHIDV